MLKEQKFSKGDRKRISDEIKTSAIFFLVLFAIIFILILIVVLLSIVLFEKRPVDGFLARGLNLIGFFFLIFIMLIHKQSIMFIDLRRNKKLVFSTSEYTLTKTKDGTMIKINSPVRLKLNLYYDIIPLVQQNQPIKVEVAKWSKTILSISQNNNNVIEMLERECVCEL